MSTRTRRRAYLILITLVVLSHAAFNRRYLQGDLFIQKKDVAAHLKLCTKFLLQARDVTRSGRSPWDCIARLTGLFHQESMPVEHIWMWPRLAYAVTAPAATLGGLTPRVIIFSNLIWLAVLLFSVFSIGSRCMNPEAGFLSALTAALLPATYGLSRTYSLDFPLTAMVALNIYWLIRSEYFSRRIPSIFLGVMTGLGLLVKEQLLIFIGAPLAFALVVGVARAFRGRTPAGRVLANAAVAALVTVVLSSPFWWGNIDNIVTVFIRHTEACEGIDPHHRAVSLMSAQCLVYYLVVAVIYVSPPLCALAALLLAPFLRSRFRARAYLLLWLAAPYAVFTAMEIKYSTYYLPALPAFACVIGAGLASLRARALKYSLCAAAVGWGLFHFAQLSFCIGAAPYKGCTLYASDALRPDGYPVWSHPAFPNNLEKVARRFIREIGCREQGNRYVRIGVCELEYSSRDYLLVDSFEYFMESVHPGVYVYRSHFATDSFLECMDSFNYLVVLEEGEKAQPDFRSLESYLGGRRDAFLSAKPLNGPAPLARLIGGYRGYELIDRALLSPEGVSVFLMRKPPFPVGDDAVIPATHLVSANVFISYPLIGVDESLRRPPTIGDYDVLFPYDVEFPLVPPGRRDPRERYYAAYRLAFEREGDYALSAETGGGGCALLDAEFDGRPVGRPRPGAGDGAPVGSFRAPRGPCELRLLGRDGFPVISGVILRRLNREGPAPRPPS